MLLALRPIFKQFLPPRWVYLLWAIPVVRLIIVAPFDLPETVAQSPLVAAQTIKDQIAALPAEALKSAPAYFDWTNLLALVWLAGALLLLVRLALATFHWSRRLDAASDIDSAETRQLLESCRREIGAPTVRLVQLSGFASPSLTGLFEPTIVLPQDFLERFTPDELRWIFLHELAHLKRWDLSHQFICQIAQAVHWFNPLVWIAFHCMRADRELACDAYVLDRTSTPQDYGHALIKVAELYPRSFSSPGFLGITEQKTDLDERVHKISRHRRPTLTWAISGFIVLILLGAFFLTKATQKPPHEATAKLQIFTVPDYVPPEIEVIQSLSNVVAAVIKLGLDAKWGKELGEGHGPLSPSEIMDRVSAMLTVRQLPGSSVIYVTVRDNDSKEGAEIANSIVAQYMDTKNHQSQESRLLAPAY